MPQSETALADAYAYCERLARFHYENFPVASRLLPAPMRPHVAAVYAFARAADDLADEGVASPADRRCRLDEWLARLRTALEEGVDANQPLRAPEASAKILAALTHTIRVCRLPVPLFEDLISAFRQDTTTDRYATWLELLDYCRRSANPVGRLVLRIAGHDNRALDEASDALCTALQLTNFWQDLEIDWRRGRLYVPSEEWRAAGADERDLTERQLTLAWRSALAKSAERTRELYAAGRAIGDRINGRFGFELRLTWLGGMRILERLERVGFDVFTARPALGPWDGAVILTRAIRWKRIQSEI